MLIAVLSLHVAHSAQEVLHDVGDGECVSSAAASPGAWAAHGRQRPPPRLWSALAALVVDHLEAEDGEGAEEDHEGAEDAEDGADEGGAVVEALLQVGPDGDAAAARNGHLHRAVMLSSACPP